MTIGETRTQYDITADILRYPQRIGLISPVLRSNSGIRAGLRGKAICSAAFSSRLAVSLRP